MKRKSALFILLIILLVGCSNSKEIGVNQSYVHISLDDVKLSVENFADKKYESLWDELLFCVLKKYHETYGAVFSLYVFEETFQLIGDEYQTEFSDCAD